MAGIPRGVISGGFGGKLWGIGVPPIPPDGGSPMGGPPAPPGPPGGPGGGTFGGYLITLPVGTEFWDRILDPPFWGSGSIPRIPPHFLFFSSLVKAV